MNKELEEAINFLEKMLKEYKTFGDLDNPEFEDTEKIYKQIETVLKELERLQEENSIQRTQLNDAFSNGFIHKDKIREKIEEQKELKEKYLKMREYGQVDIKLYKIAILEEILEEK